MEANEIANIIAASGMALMAVIGAVAFLIWIIKE